MVHDLTASSDQNGLSRSGRYWRKRSYRKAADHLVPRPAERVTTSSSGRPPNARSAEGSHIRTWGSEAGSREPGAILTTALS
jgi:hypothetical protein